MHASNRPLYISDEFKQNIFDNILELPQGFGRLGEPKNNIKWIWFKDKPGKSNSNKETLFNSKDFSVDDKLNFDQFPKVKGVTLIVTKDFPNTTLSVTSNVGPIIINFDCTD